MAFPPRYTGVLTTLTMLLGAPGGVLAQVDPGALEWAQNHYGSGPLCGTATVTEVVTAGKDIVVELHVDPRWAKTLARKHEGLRVRWFSLHCPFRDAPVWDLLGATGDVRVRSELPGLRPYQLRCRQVAH